MPPLLCSGENVCVSMFDSKAPAFHRKFDSYGKEPRVVLATSLNPKIVGGNVLTSLTFFFPRFSRLTTHYNPVRYQPFVYNGYL